MTLFEASSQRIKTSSIPQQLKFQKVQLQKNSIQEFSREEKQNDWKWLFFLMPNHSWLIMDCN